MNRAALALAVIVAASARSAEPTRPYRVDQRVLHIQAALEALRDTPADAVYQGRDYVRAFARGACASSTERLKVECLVVAVGRYCKARGDAEARRCPAYMDVVLSTVLADEQLISNEKRYQIMSTYKDYRRELARELGRIQGALAVDFHLRTGESAGDEALASNIDRYCLTTSDETNLPWQTCVSSLVWFIRGPKDGE